MTMAVIKELSNKYKCINIYFLAVNWQGQLPVDAEQIMSPNLKGQFKVHILYIIAFTVCL